VNILHNIFGRGVGIRYCEDIFCLVSSLVEFFAIIFKLFFNDPKKKHRRNFPYAFTLGFHFFLIENVRMITRVVVLALLI